MKGNTMNNDALKDFLRREIGMNLDSHLEVARVNLATLTGLALAEHPDQLTMLVAIVEQLPTADRSVLESMFSALCYI
jgi:hypothetical protein